MPTFGINNTQNINIFADTLKIPIWLVKALVIEYLPCRRFEGNSIIIDYGLVTVDDIKSLKKPYVILNGVTLFHNITQEVLAERMLNGAFVGSPMVVLAKQEAFVLPEGKVSPHNLTFPEFNRDEVGDYKLRLNLHQRAIVLENEEIYQWLVTTHALISADITQRWYESTIFSDENLEELRSININYAALNQIASDPNIVQQRLEKLYTDLEVLRIKMRQTILDYHQKNKNKPEAKVGYTEEGPPQLTFFDEFTLVKVKDDTAQRRRFKVRTYIEPLFFRAACRASARARDMRKRINAGELYPILIAEEIEASAECIVLSAMCLEAYINGFVQDNLPDQAAYIERMEIRAKWLLVPNLLGKSDCFKPGSLPFDNFSLLIKWRNDDLAHYKHEFRFPVKLGELGTVSELYSICNADNSEKAVKTVREMIQRLSKHLNINTPLWVQKTDFI